MEEKKKKSSTPIIIMLLAVLLIVAGVVLIVTGNNKSFLEKKDTKKDNKQTEEKKEEEIPDKGLTPTIITEEEILQLINNTKQADFPDENWGVDYVELLAHDEEFEKILVSYGEFQADASVVVKQTIVSILNGEKSVELPGWIEGERDLTVYNFIYYSESPSVDEETEEPEIDVNESDEGAPVDSGEDLESLEEPVLDDYEYAGPALEE